MRSVPLKVKNNTHFCLLLFLWNGMINSSKLFCYRVVGHFISFGFGGLGVACWPLVPKFAGSNPAEAVGFLRAKKSSARIPSEGK